jgi:hypothetical protein
VNTPNLYPLTDATGTHGLHEFPDGETFVVRQHACGEWFTVAPPTNAQLEHFERYGTAVEAPARRKKKV